MSKFCIEIDNQPYGIHAGPVNTWDTEAEAQAVIDYWLKNKTSWAHNVEIEEVMTKKGRSVIHHYHPKNIEVAVYNG